MAEADNTAVDSTVTVLATIAGSALLLSAICLPTLISPPPASPFAEILLLAASTTVSAAKAIWPPVAPSPLPLDSSLPALITVAPTNEILPALFTALEATIAPVFLTTPFIN